MEVPLRPSVMLGESWTPPPPRGHQPSSGVALPTAPVGRGPRCSLQARAAWTGVSYVIWCVVALTPDRLEAVHADACAGIRSPRHLSTSRTATGAGRRPAVPGWRRRCRLRGPLAPRHRPAARGSGSALPVPRGPPPAREGRCTGRHRQHGPSPPSACPERGAPGERDPRRPGPAPRDRRPEDGSTCRRRAAGRSGTAAGERRPAAPRGPGGPAAGGRVRLRRAGGGGAGGHDRRPAPARAADPAPGGG